MATDLLTLIVRLILTLIYSIPEVQTQQPAYPGAFDVSRDQPVTSDPSSAVCGLPTASAFCRSTTSSSSVSRCLLVSCTSQCPSRTATPPYVDLLLSVTSGSCVVRDYVNVKPNSTQHAFSIHFLRSIALSNPTTCYIRPPVTPILGSDGAFTLAFSTWLNSNNTGFVLQKQFALLCLRPRREGGIINGPQVTLSCTMLGY